MSDRFFKNLDFSPQEILDQIYEESSKQDNYYLSPVGVWRCDVSEQLRTKLSTLFSVPFNDCGFLKTLPRSKYPIHKDVYRKSAVNMPLFDFNPDFRSFVVASQKFVNIDYSRNKFLLLNVLEYHGVDNKSLDEERVVLSIGFKDHSYEDLFSLHQQGKFLNVVV